MMKQNPNIPKFALLSMATLYASMSGENSYALTSTANLAVSSTVASECSIATTPLNFGTYSFIGANASADLTTTGSVILTCTNSAVAPIVTLGVGLHQNTGGTTAIPLRRMMSGANFLSYFIYQDAGLTIWGDTVGSGKPGIADGTPQSLTVYGTVSGGQNVPAGNYTDTVVATVTF